jgi:hypothetical protein
MGGWEGGVHQTALLCSASATHDHAFERVRELPRDALPETNDRPQTCEVFITRTPPLQATRGSYSIHKGL